MSDNALLNADVNEDNVVNDVDATLIRFYLAKTISTFPYKTNTILGDVNVDGKVNNADVSLLIKFLENSKSLSCDGTINADVNSDNIIDYTDTLILKAFVEKKISELPYQGTVKYGDVNNDGLVNLDDYSNLKNALQNNTAMTLAAELSADVNKDGKINHSDELILLAFAKKEISALPSEYKITAGDVNLDGKIDMQDVKLLSSALASQTTLAVLQTANADTTGNDVVDKTDLGVLVAYVNNKIKFLPYDPDNQPLYAKIAQGIVTTGENIWNGLKDFWSGLASGATDLGNAIADTATSAGNTIANAATSAGSAIVNAGETAYDALAGAGNSVVKAGEDAYNAIVNFFSGLFK